MLQNQLEPGTLFPVISRLARTLNVDYITLFENSAARDGQIATAHRSQWHAASDDSPHLAAITAIAFQEEGLTHWRDLLAAGELIHGSIGALSLAEQALLKRHDMQAIAVAPIFVNNSWWGFILCNDCRQEREWSSVELEFLRLAADLLEAKIENVRLRESERRAHERAEVLREFSRIVASSLDHKEVLRRSLKHLSRVLLFDSASIYLLPREGRGEFLAGIGFDDEEATTRAAENLLKESQVIQEMARTMQPIVSADVRTLDGWIWVPGAEHVRSFMSIPLVAHDVMIGALMLDNRQINSYHDTDLEMAVPLARQIAISIENAWLFEATQQQLHWAKTFQKVGALLTSRLSLTEVYENIFDLLAQVVAYDSVSIQTVQEDNQLLAMAAARGFSSREKARDFLASIEQHSLRRFPADSLWRVIPDTEKDPTWLPLPAVLGPIHSWIGALLMVKGRLIGILNVDSATPNRYNDDMGETVAAFANQAAVAIENARLYEKTRQHANELEILHQVAVQTAALVDVDELIRQTTETITGSLYPEHFGFVLLDEQAQTLVPHFSYHGASEIHGLSVPVDKGVVGHVAQTGAMWLVQDTENDLYYNNVVASTRSEIAVPLMVKGQIFGVINAESSREDAFSSSDARFLLTLAGQVAVAIERARLYEALQQHAHELSREVAARTAELRTERDRSLAILESAGEGIFLTDIEGNILYANPAMERQSGYTRDELLNQNPRVLQSDRTPLANFHDLWRTILKGQKWAGELVNQRKDGALYDVALMITPILDADGKIVNFVSVQSDISRLKEVERLKTKFVSNVSHELRTPLTNITTYLTLLERGPVERRERYMEALRQATQRLTRLIQDLLDLSRLETEPFPEALVSSDLSSLLLVHFESFAVQADAKHIRFKLDMPPSLPYVLVEKHHLGQLLRNLLGNALAFTLDGGEVIMTAGVEASVLQPAAWVKVADTGIGIPAEEMAHLFDRFFRGQAAQEMGIPGTGLGLAICAEILDRYGGRIEVKSEPGVGSQFKIWLPVAE